MKKLLFILLICSHVGFAQKYFMLIEANDRVWVTTPKGEQKSVTRNPQSIVLLQNQAIAIVGVTDGDPITHNRTILELKSGMAALAMMALMLIIVPFWN